MTHGLSCAVAGFRSHAAVARSAQAASSRSSRPTPPAPSPPSARTPRTQLGASTLPLRIADPAPSSPASPPLQFVGGIWRRGRGWIKGRKSFAAIQRLRVRGSGEQRIRAGVVETKQCRTTQSEPSPSPRSTSPRRRLLASRRQPSARPTEGFSAKTPTQRHQIDDRCTSIESHRYSDSLTCLQQVSESTAVVHTLRPPPAALAKSSAYVVEIENESSAVELMISKL